MGALKEGPGTRPRFRRNQALLLKERPYANLDADGDGSGIGSCFRPDDKAVPYGGHICRNQYQIGFRIRRNPALWGQKHDDYGFQICSLLVFDRSAEQIGANPPVYGFPPISLALALC